MEGVRLALQAELAQLDAYVVQPSPVSATRDPATNRRCEEKARDQRDDASHHRCHKAHVARMIDGGWPTMVIEGRDGNEEAPILRVRPANRAPRERGPESPHRNGAPVENIAAR